MRRRPERRDPPSVSPVRMETAWAVSRRPWTMAGADVGGVRMEAARRRVAVRPRRRAGCAGRRTHVRDVHGIEGLVPGARLELAHCLQYWILSPARLPVPPSRPRCGTRRMAGPRREQRIIPQQTPAPGGFGSRPVIPAKREDVRSPTWVRRFRHRKWRDVVSGCQREPSGRSGHSSEAGGLRCLHDRKPASRVASSLRKAVFRDAGSAGTVLCYHRAPCVCPISITSCRRS